MNKTVSLPKIRQLSQEKSETIRSRKISIDSLQLDVQKSSVNNEQNSIRIKNKQHVANLQYIQKKGSISAKIDVLLTDRSKIGILDNQKNAKFAHKSLLKISNETNKQSKTQTQETNKFLSKIKKELNDYSNQNKKVYKQIRNTQAKLAQIKEQINLYQYELTPKQSKIQKKLEQTQVILNWQKYQKDVWKNIKENIKTQNAFLQKRSINLTNLLRKVQKNVQILTQKDNMKEEQLNREIYMMRQFQNYEKTKSQNIEFQLSKAQQKLKQNAATQRAIKQQEDVNFIQEDQYHDSVYRKKQRQIRRQLNSHKIYASMLQRLWEKQGNKYKDIQKCQKLLIMYCQNNDIENFNPSKQYFSSFQTKNQLNSKIKQKQEKINELKKKNQKLKAQWDQYIFKQTQIQEEIIKKLDKNIATGKIEQKEVAAKEKNQYNKAVIEKLEKLKNQTNLNSRIKVWIKKIQESLGIKVSKKSKADEHLSAILSKVSEQIKQNQKKFVQLKKLNDKRPSKLATSTKLLIKTNGFNPSSPFRKKK